MSMNTTTRKLTKAASMMAKMGQSEYGTLQPQLDVRFPRGTHYRVLTAALHALAADVELATPPTLHWCVQMDAGNESGRVYLELADGTEDEAKRGLALLRGMLG
jgi:hypothetical protein